MGKREVNKKLIREKLLMEALRLFSERGFEQTTVADIVTAAGIGRGTFYNYFSDIKSIFDAVIDQLNDEIRVVVKEARKEARNTYELLYASFKSYFDWVSQDQMRRFHQNNRDYIRSTAYGSESTMRNILELQADLNSHKAFGPFEKPHEFQLLSFVFIGTPPELFLNIQASGMEVSNEEIATFLAKLFTQGVEKPDKVKNNTKHIKK